MSLNNIKSKFFVKNFLKGLLILAVIITLYLLAKRYFDIDSYMLYLGQWPFLVYLTFTLSEIIFGIIPPELFIIWVIQNGIVGNFIADVFLLATMSYLAGVFGYFLGKEAKKWRFMDSIMGKYVLKYSRYMRRYGGFLIVIGAMTPLPFSAVCMLMGTSGYEFKRFLYLSLMRFVRFGIYGWIIWQTTAV
jgi:hypothetical protein